MSKALPPVPRDASKSVQQFLTALRETVQIQAGMGRGNSLDRAVTFRDFQQATGSPDIRLLATKSSTGVVTAFNDPKPTRPTNFEAFGMFNLVGLEWDRPKAVWYAFTEVYRYDVTGDESATPVFADAVFVGSSATGFFSDMTEPAKTFVYWIRHVNRDYVVGDISSPEGTRASTSETPEQVLIKYSEEIAGGENFKWLRSDISVMDAINRSLQGSGLGDTGLAKLLNDSTSLSDLLAEQAMSDSIYKHTESQNIQLQFSKNYARLSGGIHAAVNADEAYVLRVQELESKWENELGDVIASKITDFSTSLASKEGAIAETINTYSVDFKGVNTSLQQLANATASLDNGYKAQWGVKTDVAGLKGGAGFLNDGTKTSFIVDAQTFAVTGGSDSLFPFIIKDGKTVMDKALIQNAEIYELLAANIVAERIKVGVSFSSPVIKGGSIDGATLTVGSGFSVSSTGVLRAKDGFFEGDIKATNGTLENVRIGESCTVEGTLYANNIEGDIVDRNVIVVQDEIKVGPNEIYIVMSGNIAAGLLGATHDRILVISGIALDHENGGGSTSNFDVRLMLDGTMVQIFHSHSANEEGSVTVQLGCKIPKGTARHSFSVEVQPSVNDNLLVQQSAIVADIFKTGSTLTQVEGLYFKEVVV